MTLYRQTKTAYNTEFTEKSYEEQIEELMASTGIDIYALSELKEVKEVATKQLQMMNAFAVVTTEHSNAKGGELTEEKVIQLENLGKSINAAHAAGNDYEVLRLYESLCAICMTIDGFMPSMKISGLQTFTFDTDKATLELPLAYMEAE